ncbi:MAG: prepilin peptidase, partial [Planctomycetota bacterium]|nr:prepilin peptidase [Planctomycetota bacterium]
MAWWELLHEAPVLWPLFLILFGITAGSFSSAAVYRLPREGMSMTQPLRSLCPACGETLTLWENLPLVGWLALRGRSRCCDKPIALGYLLHEVGLGALFLWAGLTSWTVGLGPLAFSLFLIVLVALWIAAVIDWQHYILPDEITLLGIPFGILASLAVPEFQMGPTLDLPWGCSWLGLHHENPAWMLAGASSILGASLSFLLLFGIRALFSYLLGQEALGLGDVKYLSAVGALVGPEGAAWTFLIGVAFGALLGLGNVLRMIFVVHRRRIARGRRTPLRSSCHFGWLLGRRIPFG